MVQVAQMKQLTRIAVHLCCAIALLTSGCRSSYGRKVTVIVPDSFSGTILIYEQVSRGAAPDSKGNLDIACRDGVGFVRSFDDWPPLFAGKARTVSGIPIPVVDSLDTLRGTPGDHFAYGLGTMGSVSANSVHFRYSIFFVGNRARIGHIIAHPSLYENPDKLIRLAPRD
jgi:hypothetical protein